LARGLSELRSRPLVDGAEQVSGEGIKRADCKSRCSAEGRTTDDGDSGYAESGDAGGWTKGAD